MRDSGQVVQGLAGHDEVINRPSSQEEDERRVVGLDLGAGSRCGWRRTWHVQAER